jgi:hypothetical protein
MPAISTMSHATTPPEMEKKDARPSRQPWFNSRDLIAKNKRYWRSGGNRSDGLTPKNIHPDDHDL